MIRGLAIFREHFSEYKDSYVLIGGSACSLLMENAGLEYRVTKDLDIVLCIEALSKEFVEHFWDFVKNGNYKTMNLPPLKSFRF